MFCLEERINHFSLIYKVVLLGPQETLDAFRTSPQKHVTGLGHKQLFFLIQEEQCFSPRRGGAGGNPSKYSTHLNMILL